jgi:hypothetical protein
MALYPPDLENDAIDLVLRQAEVIGDIDKQIA